MTYPPPLEDALEGTAVNQGSASGDGTGAEHGSASVIGTMGMPGPAAPAPSGKPPSFSAVILLILLPLLLILTGPVAAHLATLAMIHGAAFWELGRASSRERVCRYGL